MPASTSSPKIKRKVKFINDPPSPTAKRMMLQFENKDTWESKVSLVGDDPGVSQSSECNTAFISDRLSSP